MRTLCLAATLFLSRVAYASEPPIPKEAVDLADMDSCLESLGAVRVAVDLVGSPEERAAFSAESLKRFVVKHLESEGIPIQRDGQPAEKRLPGLLTVRIQLLTSAERTSFAVILDIVQLARLFPSDRMKMVRTWGTSNVGVFPGKNNGIVRDGVTEGLGEFVKAWKGAHAKAPDPFGKESR